MTTLNYDIVPHEGGWAIVVTPNETPAFATKQQAFDAAADQARKLRFAGYPMLIRGAARTDRERKARAS